MFIVVLTSTETIIGAENPALPKPVVISTMPPATNSLSSVPLITSTLPTAAGITKAAPGQQLILTQGAGGLTPMALSQVILPGANAAGGQPIYLTTQGIPVQNLQTAQSPMSIVLNVQQGQAVRPITLVQAPGTPGIFKPAQIITQQAPMRPTTQVVTRTQAPGPFSTVQIPATLTIRTTAPVSQPRVKFVSQVTQPSATARTIPINTQTKIVTVKAGDGNLDVQNLMSLMNTVSLPGMGQPQTLIVMSNQKANGASPAAPTSVPVTQTSAVQGKSPLYHTCPRCKAKFKMAEALQGHMCFCCPDVTRSASTDAPAAKPLIVQNKSLPVQVKSESIDNSPEEPQPRIVMLVDDFYYGTYEGNRVYVASDNEKGPRSFKCLTCGKKLKSNIRLMNHMKFHVEQQSDEADKHTCCPHCFRQFPSPSRLQSHVESVHNTRVSSSKCKICEWAFESEPVFLQHMKNTHKPGEMPYVCQVCEYRSSLYSDVHDHFRTWHEDTRFLLCIYCLKVFKHSSTYQQHFSRHQNSSVYHCNKCRLQFLATKEKIEHKVNHHKTFRRPSQLEGLQAGTKVTIRAYAAKKTAGPLSSKIGKETTNTSQFGQASAGNNLKLLSPQNTAAGRKQVSKMYDYLVKFQEQRVLFGRQKCVECTFDIPDFANHYPTYVHCSLCLYSTCCSRAYANHMINYHVPGRIHKSRTKKVTVSWLKLTCACCNYTTTQGDLMAKHLVQFPDHHHCAFFMKGNPSIGFVEHKRESIPPALGSSTPRSIARGSSVDESATSMEASSMQDEDLDQELAPLEGSDSEFETDDSSQEEPPRTKDGPRENPISPKTSIEKEETLSVRQLRILLFALCSGIKKAAKEMNTNPQLIKAWLRDKEKRLDQEGLGNSSKEAIERLVEWVLVEREQQRIVNEKNLFQKASEIHMQTSQSSSFRISYEWAVSFMLKHKLGLQSPVMMLSYHQLPRSMEENCLHFTGFVQRQIQMHSVPHSAVGAMDELSVFVDFDSLVEANSTSREAAFRLEGREKPWMNIYLSSMADGTMLPTFLFLKGTPFSKSLPDSLLLESRVYGFSENEELEIWNSRVWQQHLNSQNGSKTILAMDGHHSHMSEGFVSTMSGTKTLPVIIPPGCTGQLQPLEMCVNPVLKKFLLARWSQFANQQTKVTPVGLAQVLVTWLDEFLACCSGRPELIKHSFCLSHVIAEQEECKKEANAQLELINKLTEALLGPKAVESEVLSEDESMETCVEGAVEANTRLITEKSPHTKEYVKQAESKTAGHEAETKKKETEQKAQESMHENLDDSSETTSNSSSSPAPHTLPLSPSQLPEEEELIEPIQDSDSSVTDVSDG
uniref:Pogo transposable element derived with ZNF domain b n=1 Tax=Astyanax mexicanus TaxID=7994 RepID=A0A8B9J4R2_ASTMX